VLREAGRKVVARLRQKEWEGNKSEPVHGIACSYTNCRGTLNGVKKREEEDARRKDLWHYFEIQRRRLTILST
jgi:hypothetical protein